MWHLTGERWIHAIIGPLISSDDLDLLEDRSGAMSRPSQQQLGFLSKIQLNQYGQIKSKFTNSATQDMA